MPTEKAPALRRRERQSSQTDDKENDPPLSPDRNLVRSTTERFDVFVDPVERETLVVVAAVEVTRLGELGRGHETESGGAVVDRDDHLEVREEQSATREERNDG